jgi:hypothetical protein
MPVGGRIGGGPERGGEKSSLALVPLAYLLAYPPATWCEPLSPPPSGPSPLSLFCPAPLRALWIRSGRKGGERKEGRYSTDCTGRGPGACAGVVGRAAQEPTSRAEPSSLSILKSSHVPPLPSKPEFGPSSAKPGT